MVVTVFFSLTLFFNLQISRATVEFADKQIRNDVARICQEFELIKQMFTQLCESKYIYVIKYGVVEGHADAVFETDGEKLYLIFKKFGEYSLQAKFAHEATHALQFEREEIAFFQDRTGGWTAVNIDIWDEAEAFQNMITVATGTDLSGCMGKNANTNLRRFKRKLEDKGFVGAAQWLRSIYRSLEFERKNNPFVNQNQLNTIWMKRGCKFFYIPYQLATEINEK